MPVPPTTLTDLASQLSSLQGSVNMVYSKLSKLELEPAPQLATVAFGATIPPGHVFAFVLEDGHAIVATRLTLSPGGGLIIDEIRTADNEIQVLGAPRPRPETGELNTLPPDFRFGGGRLMRPGDRVIVRNPTDREVQTSLIISGTLETPTEHAGRLEYENRLLRAERAELERLLDQEQKLARAEDEDNKQPEKRSEVLEQIEKLSGVNLS